MKNKIINYFKSDSLWIQVLGAIIAASILGLITFILGLFNGLDYQSSIQWTIDILTIKINLIWFLIFILIVIIGFKRNSTNILKKIDQLSYTKEQVDRKNEEIKKKLNNKVDLFRFERFSDVYDYRRLKSHPWHEQYIDDVDSFIKMIEEGNDKSDTYKFENGMSGLILELKERGWVHRSEKDKIKELLNNNFSDTFSHSKDELNKIIDTIKVL